MGAAQFALGRRQRWRTPVGRADARMGAALSYYSVFSIGPFILIAVAVAGLVFGRRAVQETGFAVSFGMMTLLFALMFRWLPDVEAYWKDVWLAAVCTAALFEIGKFLIGFYIGKQGLESTYGAASSLVVMLTWVYCSAQIVLLGAEFTHSHAKGASRLPEDVVADRAHG